MEISWQNKFFAKVLCQFKILLQDHFELLNFVPGKNCERQTCRTLDIHP